MKDKETVCAVVVTYNRKDLLIECLDALKKQTRSLDAIYVIDNASRDNTPELLRENGYIKELPPKDLNEPWEREFKVNNLVNNNPIKIHYVRMNENTGGAGGFHEGVKRSYKKGYDWLWLMDDDGLPDKNCLNNLLDYRNKGDFLAPLVINKDKKEELSFGIWDENNKKIIRNKQEIKKEIYEKTANPFNGILISKKLVNEIGYPKKEMFIWGDEVEYMLRVLSNDFNVYTISKAYFFHPKGSVEQIKVNSKVMIEWEKMNKLKNYCNIRNKVYLYKNYKKYFKINSIKFYVVYLLAFIYQKITLKEFVFFNIAFFDGIFERWGKEKRYLTK